VRQDLAGITGKFAEQVILCWRQVNLLATRTDKAMGKIDEQAILSSAAVARTLHLAAYDATT
jgi:hypothetical protein